MPKLKLHITRQNEGAGSKATGPPPQRRLTRSSRDRPIKMQVSSDLHMERLPEYTLDLVELVEHAKYLILAGDIGSLGRQNHHRPFRRWLIGISMHFTKVFYIVGNHDCRGTTLEQGHDVLKQWENDRDFGGRLKFLEKDRYDLNDDGHNVTILGCTLWTKRDNDERGNVSAEAWDDESITDNTPAEHHRRYEESIKWLRDEIKKVPDEKGKRQRIVVVTHHAPSLRDTMKEGNRCQSLNKYANDILGGEGIDGLGENDFWVFGHTHYSCSLKIDRVNVFANQRGSAFQEKEEQEIGGARIEHHWRRDGCIEV